jgi:hypothetical protein
MRSILIRTVFLRPIAPHVMFVLNVLSILLRLVLRALLVKPVLALCLGQLVDLCASESGEELFGELVGYRLA